MNIDSFLVSQIIAGIAFFFGSYAFLLEERKQILRALFLTAVLVAIHFIVLGEYTAALFLCISALRFLIASISVNKKWLIVFLSFAVINIMATYSSPINILSFLAMIIATIGSFQENVKAVRLSMATASVFWIIHNTVVWTPVAVIMETTFLAFNSFGYHREHKRLLGSRGKNKG